MKCCVLHETVNFYKLFVLDNNFLCDYSFCFLTYSMVSRIMCGIKVDLN